MHSQKRVQILHRQESRIEGTLFQTPLNALSISPSISPLFFFFFK